MKKIVEGANRLGEDVSRASGLDPIEIMRKCLTHEDFEAYERGLIEATQTAAYVFAVEFQGKMSAESRAKILEFAASLPGVEMATARFVKAIKGGDS